MMLLSACEIIINTPQGTIPGTETPDVGAITTETPASTTTPEISLTSAATATVTIPTTSVLTETNVVTTTAVLTATPVATATEAVSDTQVTTVAPSATTTPVAAISGRFVDIPALDTDMTDMTIGEIISSAEGFSTLTTALEQANLLTLLNGPGPLTLFAPTDNAFLNYPDSTINELLANPTMLVDLLQYHLIVDDSPVAQLAELGGAVTYLGEPVDIAVAADGEMFVNDAVIVQTDIQASNGVIHVINGLLVPPSAQSLLSSRTVNPEAETDMGTRDLTLEQLAGADTSGLTVLEIISSIDGFTTLAAAIDAAGLNDALSTGGPITLLAPTNGAFAEIPDLELEALLNAQPEELLNLLQYHLILDGVTSADLAQLGIVITATGDPVTATIDNDGVIMLNDGAATVYMADIEASNGVIHAISAVLTPPTQ